MFAESFDNYPVLANLLALGIGVTVVMSVINWFAIDEKTFKSKNINHWINIISLHLSVMFCIATVGGIIDAFWMAPLWFGIKKAEFTGIEYIALTAGCVLFFILPALLTYIVGYWVMGLSNYTKKYSQVIFIVTFLVSIIFFCDYIGKYDTNVEITTETQPVTEERELIFFYEIPVQDISGELYGSYTRGNGEIAGEIFSKDTVTYLYFNEEGKGEWDFAPVENADITFITEQDKPKVVIVTNIDKEIRIDHNSGKTEVLGENSWCEYHFYLPQSLIRNFESVEDK